jgi:hypothetical protein
LCAKLLSDCWWLSHICAQGVVGCADSPFLPLVAHRPGCRQSHRDCCDVPGTAVWRLAYMCHCPGCSVACAMSLML